MEEGTREYWRTRAYQLQATINRYKAGRLIDTLPARPEPVDSGRGTAKQWERMCRMLVRYAKAYTGGNAPSGKLIDGLTVLRAKMWD